MCNKSRNPVGMRLAAEAAFRFLAGILMLSMAALPLTTFQQEGPVFAIVPECFAFLEHFLGSRTSAWLATGFFISIPLTGLYMLIEPVVQLTRKKQIKF